MILYPLTVIVSLALWGLFAETVSGGGSEFVAWATFGLAFVSIVWVIHEAVRLLPGNQTKDQ